MFPCPSRGIGSVLPAAGGYRCLCHWKTGAAVDPAGFGHWLVSQGLLHHLQG